MSELSNTLQSCFGKLAFCALSGEGVKDKEKPDQAGQYRCTLFIPKDKKMYSEVPGWGKQADALHKQAVKFVADLRAVEKQVADSAFKNHAFSDWDRLIDGDTKENEGYHGYFMLRTHTLFKIKAYDAAGLVIPEDRVDSEFPNGVWGRVDITVKDFSKAGKKGCTCYLNKVQKVYNGSEIQFGGSSEAFAPIAGIEAQEGDFAAVNTTEDLSDFS